MVIRLDRHSAGEKPINTYWHDCRCLAGSARWQVVIIALALGALAGCSDPQGAESAEQQSAGSPLRTRLLTADQYANSIAQLFGEDIAESILPPIPPMARTDGLLASGSAFVGVTSDQVSQIQQTAASIAAQVVDQDHRDFLIPCSPEETEAADTSCAALFLEETGRLLFRRPLSYSRLSDLVHVADYAAEQTGDFYDGLALALEAMLISPDFIFIADRAEADPDAPGQQRLDAYSLASRLSFLLWNAPPDDVLLQEAGAGLLHTQQGLAKAVDRMLGSARLESGVRAFFDDLMAFDEFNSLAKDPLVYPWSREPLLSMPVSKPCARSLTILSHGRLTTGIFSPRDKPSCPCSLPQYTVRRPVRAGCLSSSKKRALVWVY